MFIKVMLSGAFVLSIVFSANSRVEGQNSPVQPSSQTEQQKQSSEIDKQVRKLEHEWLDAYEKRDAEAMNRILADDFKITYGSGTARTKADVLAEIKAAQNSGQAPPKFSTEETQLRVEGETVILTGIFIQQGGRGTMRARYRDVYAKRDGRWQVLSSQLTRIPTAQNQSGANQSSVQTQVSQSGGGNSEELPVPKMKFPDGKSIVEVPFETVGNWMVIPVRVNGSRPLRFVLDTGASGPVLFNLSLAHSLNLKFTGTRQASGAGGGGASFEVKVAEDVNFNIGGIELSKGSLSQRPSNSGVDGVIGRAVFAATVVEIDWESRIVKFYDPAKFKYSGSGAVLPLTFDRGGRPYTMAAVSVSGEKTAPIKLVVDTGGSHALFLELASKAGFKPPEGATKAVLGRGASGEITGFTGRAKEFQLGKYSVKDVPVSFLDASSGTAGLNDRDGNLGGGILRRFKVIYDYSRRQIIVEPNKFIDEPFAVPTITSAASNTAPATNVSSAAMQDYVGRFDERTVSFESGALFIQRPGGPKLKMIAATTKDEFTLEQITAAKIKFVRNEAGKITEVQVLNREGQWEASKKDQR